MYVNEDNISIIVRLLKENKIRDLVISPGGTNIPIVEKVQDDDYFSCHSIIDERSAAYVAIGIYLQRKKPVALICTSAQATRNYIPGLTEAFYKRIPILAITMEKHPRFKYQEYMQAPDQTSLPKDSVKKSVELPFVTDINDYYHSIRLVNEAILELYRNGMGPVQLCVPWLDFPLKDLRPQIRLIRRFDARDIKDEDLLNKKVLIVIGEHIPFGKNDTNAIEYFCKCTNAAVYTNHLSNYNGKYSVNGNLFLLTARAEEIEEIKPDIIISIGGQTGDYPFYLSFANNALTGVEHWRITECGDVVDTYDKLTRIYQGKIEDFFTSVNLKNDVVHNYYLKWKEKIDSKSNRVDVPFSNIAIAQLLHKKLPANSIVQFAILNSLRIWNMFDIDSSIECYSNVGAFGIDGGMSTLIGQSIVTEKLSFMITGDLAFFYDMNCLGIREIRNNVRILLINNNGGIEFKLSGKNNKQIDRYIAAADYHGKAKDWAESCGFIYYAANSIDEFKQYADSFVANSEKPILLEAFVSDLNESDAYLEILNKNRERDAKDYVKGVVKDILGDKMVNKIKHVIKG